MVTTAILATLLLYYVHTKNKTFKVDIFSFLLLHSGIFERKLAMLVVLQRESSWKGGGDWGDSH